MSRSLWAMGVLAATAGCGVTALAPSVPSGASSEVPEIASVARAVAAAGRRNRVAGYYWIGYTPADFGAGELSGLGSGDGFTCGLGLTLSEGGRAFLEVAFEKTVNHDYQAALVPQTGHHERVLVGGRSTATAMARMEKQPRPYLSYGVSTNKYRVDIAAGGTYEASGLGLYAGLGVEYPLGQKTSFSFDTRYHSWSDTDSEGVTGGFASVAFSLLYVGRF